MTGKARRGDGPVLIKKYGNRRLYDTSRSRYITLGELARMVQSGATVRIVDAASGKNLTRAVLLQVILEQQDATEMIPAEFLHAVIRAQGTLEQAPFSAVLSAFTRQLASATHLWAQPMANLFRGLSGTAAPPAKSPAASPPATGEPPGGEPPEPVDTTPPDGPVEGLRRRIDSLLRQVHRDRKSGSR